MIYFNSVTIDSVAPVKVVDVNISPIKRAPLVRERAIRPGAHFVRVRDSERTVQITFALLTQAMDVRQSQIDALTAWARSDTPGELKLPGHEGRFLKALCTGFPEPSTRQWWESRLRFTFTCYDPYWYNATAKSVACGTSFTPLGNVPPRIVITRTLGSSASDQEYKNTNASEIMHFSTIPAGNLSIDLDAQTAAVSGTSIMQYFTYGSKFITPVVGAQTIQGTGTVWFQERWA